MWKTILRKSKGVIRVFFISLYVIAVIVTWVLSISYINKRLENQMLTFIDEIAREKAAWIDSIMVAKLGLLESMADELAELENYIFSMEIEDIIELKEWMGVDGLAFIDDNGCAYTSEGKIEDVSDEPIYQIAIDGVPYISGLLESTENEKGIIVYGVPIISPEGDKSSIIGVLAATTKAENFILEYSPKSNQEKGYIYIIDNEGNIIEGTASMDELEMDNILEQVKKRKGNPVAIEKLEKALANHKKTNLYYENNGENYAVCVSLNMNEWSMMMVVPGKSIEQQFKYASYSIHILFSIAFALSITLVIYNIMNEKKSHIHLKKIAYINRNTGLYNKNYLRDHFGVRILEAKEKHTVLVIYNIQKFKLLNEIYGTELGNKILIEVANVLNNSKKYESEIVIHGYADEFATVYFYESKRELENRIKDNLDIVKNAVYDKYKIRVDIAVGIYEIEDSKCPLESIYTLASVAKNKNKESVTELFTYYSKDFAEVELERKKLEDSIREGIKNKEFKAWFQPQFDSVSNKITGCESLARWHKSDGTVLTPYYFIEVSERCNLICDIDKLMFEDVCKNIKEWMDKGLLCVPVSVNLSRAHLQNSEIVQELKEIADKYKVPTELIQVEITESAMIENENILKQVIGSLHEIGFKVLLDDFGVGYSSLMAINFVNFDVLKIDKSFVDAIDTKNGKFIIEYTIHLGRQLGMDIIIEGVETKEQVEYFSQMDQVVLQGYYFSKPVDSVTIQSFIQNN